MFPWRRIDYSLSSSGERSTMASEAPSSPYLEKLVKLIPVEVVSFYIAVSAILNAATDAHLGWYRLAAFVATTLATPVYLWRVTASPGARPAVKQIVLSTIAFAIWAIAIEQPLSVVGFNNPLVKALLVPVFTFIAALI